MPRGRAIVSGVIASVGACLAMAPASVAALPAVSFITQGCTTWSAPAGVKAVEISATGAAGTVDPFAGPAGKGARVMAVLSGLKSGSTLDVCVDYGGGLSGMPGDAGGGASGVSLGNNFAHPVVVAGGGGAGGTGFVGGGGTGGDAGSIVGLNGGAGNTGGLGKAGGGRGGDNLTMRGGAGGSGDQTGEPGGKFTAAGPGTGGEGGGFIYGGGGGGAGYFGGGGGAESIGRVGGGGGGTSVCRVGLNLFGCVFAPDAGTQSVAGGDAGDASVVLKPLG